MQPDKLRRAEEALEFSRKKLAALIENSQESDIVEARREVKEAESAVARIMLRLLLR